MSSKNNKPFVEEDFNPTFSELIRFTAEEIAVGSDPRQRRINQAFLALLAGLVAAEFRGSQELPSVEQMVARLTPETGTV